MSLAWLDLNAQIEGIEWIILLVIVGGVLLWGPQKLPEFARGVGRALGEFQRGRMEIEREIRGQFSELTTTAPTQAPRAERAAAALGLPFTEKSELSLKLDVARVLDHATTEQIASAARALGVFGPQASMAELRDLILKELSR